MWVNARERTFLSSFFDEKCLLAMNQQATNSSCRWKVKRERRNRFFGSKCSVGFSNHRTWTFSLNGRNQSNRAQNKYFKLKTPRAKNNNDINLAQAKINNTINNYIFEPLFTFGRRHRIAFSRSPHSTRCCWFFSHRNTKLWTNKFEQHVDPLHRHYKFWWRRAH